MLTQQADLLREHRLVVKSAPSLDDDAAIIAQLKKTPLVSFSQLTKLIDGSLPEIRVDMVALLEPKTVTVKLSSGVIVKTMPELEAYLADLRARAKSKLDKGSPVMLK
ncbi:hypothetical protein DSECCO2_571800 [anaerobic digester metagenome]